MKKPSDNSYDAEIYAVPKLYKPKKTKVNTLNLYNKMLSLKTQPMLKRFAYKNNINNINKTNITVVPNSTNNILYINAWILLKDNNLRPRNYGDDINYSFLSELIT